jgi:hypothetical protein
MGLIIQQRALQAAGGLRQVLREVRAGLQLAVAYGYAPTTKVKAVDIALDEVCAMSWRLSGR